MLKPHEVLSVLIKKEEGGSLLTKGKQHKAYLAQSCTFF
jgi:hypothetical protein